MVRISHSQNPSVTNGKERFGQRRVRHLDIHVDKSVQETGSHKTPGSTWGPELSEVCL
jgi:hypothetical protein